MTFSIDNPEGSCNQCCSRDLLVRDLTTQDRDFWGPRPRPGLRDPRPAKKMVLRPRPRPRPGLETTTLVATPPPPRKICLGKTLREQGSKLLMTQLIR